MGRALHPGDVGVVTGYVDRVVRMSPPIAADRVYRRHVVCSFVVTGGAHAGTRILLSGPIEATSPLRLHRLRVACNGGDSSDAPWCSVLEKIGDSTWRATLESSGVPRVRDVLAAMPGGGRAFEPRLRLVFGSINAPVASRPTLIAKAQEALIGVTALMRQREVLDHMTRGLGAALANIVPPAMLLKWIYATDGIGGGTRPPGAVQRTEHAILRVFLRTASGYGIDHVRLSAAEMDRLRRMGDVERAMHTWADDDDAKHIVLVRKSMQRPLASALRWLSRLRAAGRLDIHADGRPPPELVVMRAANAASTAIVAMDAGRLSAVAETFDCPASAVTPWTLLRSIRPTAGDAIARVRHVIIDAAHHLDHQRLCLLHETFGDALAGSLVLIGDAVAPPSSSGGTGCAFSEIVEHWAADQVRAPVAAATTPARIPLRQLRHAGAVVAVGAGVFARLLSGSVDSVVPWQALFRRNMEPARRQIRAVVLAEDEPWTQGHEAALRSVGCNMGMLQVCCLDDWKGAETAPPPPLAHRLLYDRLWNGATRSPFADPDLNV